MLSVTAWTDQAHHSKKIALVALSSSKELDTWACRKSLTGNNNRALLALQVTVFSLTPWFPKVTCDASVIVDCTFSLMIRVIGVQYLAGLWSFCHWHFTEHTIQYNAVIFFFDQLALTLLSNSAMWTFPSWPEGGVTGRWLGFPSLLSLSLLLQCHICLFLWHKLWTTA